MVNIFSSNSTPDKPKFTMCLHCKLKIWHYDVGHKVRVQFVILYKLYIEYPLCLLLLLNPYFLKNEQLPKQIKIICINTQANYITRKNLKKKNLF